MKALAIVVGLTELDWLGMVRGSKCIRVAGPAALPDVAIHGVGCMARKAGIVVRHEVVLIMDCRNEARSSLSRLFP